MPLAVLFLAIATTSSALTVPPEMMVIPPEPPKEWTVASMQDLAREKAKAHGLKVQKFLDVIECESGWNKNAVGDNGTSFGLAQLRYPLRDWGITRDQAKDPEIALETMATAWDNGLASKWSCWSP